MGGVCVGSGTCCLTPPAGGAGLGSGWKPPPFMHLTPSTVTEVAEVAVPPSHQLCPPHAAGGLSAQWAHPRLVLGQEPEPEAPAGRPAL